MTDLDLAPTAARRALAPLRADLEDDDAAVERFALAVWNHVTEPGDSVAGRLVAAHGATDALRLMLGAAPFDSAAVPQGDFAEGCRRWLPRVEPDRVLATLRTAGAVGARLVTWDDPLWPSQLDGLGPHRPLCLWVRGDATLLPRLQPSVAIVGARASTSYGDHVANEMAADLAGGGVPVVSGGAYGIDGAAHRAALAVEGRTVAMLAGGLDRPYPAGHADLIERIIAKGVVVSEVPCGSAPTKWRFLQRNRLIAAISDATVVVEAGWRSGSINTAGHALDLGRPLGAVPGAVTSAASAGTHRLLREYGATCVTCADEVRELIGLDGSTGPAAPGERPRTDDTTRVRDALSGRVWLGSEDLARRSGMATHEVEAALGLLYMEGEVESSPRGWRRATLRT